MDFEFVNFIHSLDLSLILLVYPNNVFNQFKYAF